MKKKTASVFRSETVFFTIIQYPPIRLPKNPNANAIPSIIHRITEPIPTFKSSLCFSLYTLFCPFNAMAAMNNPTITSITIVAVLIVPIYLMIVFLVNEVRDLHNNHVWGMDWSLHRTLYYPLYKIL